MSAGHHHQGQPLDAQGVAEARQSLLSPEKTDRLTDMLTLLADPTRLRLLYALEVVDELCVGDLALAVGSSEDATGYALRLLRTAGLVERRKQGRVVYYRLARDYPQALRQHNLDSLISRRPGGEAE